MDYESILVVPVPAAESIVGPFRIQYDPSAPLGMPAHITVNYPFVFPQSNTPNVIENLRTLFAGSYKFAFSLASLGRFPGVLYFEPTPVHPFVELMEAVVEQFPESPPYGGRFENHTPHLTVAQVADEGTLDRVGARLMDACRDQLPIETMAAHVWLMDNKPGMWTKRVSFDLAESTDGAG